MTNSYDIQVLRAAYEQHFLKLFLLILCCCRIEDALLTNANFNLALVHEFEYQ
jgi:hypothetical protein